MRGKGIRSEDSPIGCAAGALGTLPPPFVLSSKISNLPLISVQGGALSDSESESLERTQCAQGSTTALAGCKGWGYSLGCFPPPSHGTSVQHVPPAESQPASGEAREGGGQDPSRLQWP